MSLWAWKGEPGWNLQIWSLFQSKAAASTLWGTSQLEVRNWTGYRRLLPSMMSLSDIDCTHACPRYPQSSKTHLDRMQVLSWMKFWESWSDPNNPLLRMFHSNAFCTVRSMLQNAPLLPVVMVHWPQTLWAMLWWQCLLESALAFDSQTAEQSCQRVIICAWHSCCNSII